MTDFKALREYADTPSQHKKLDAIIAADGNISQAATALKMNLRGLMRTVSVLKRRGATQGWSPEHDKTHKVPAPFVLKGTSTLYGPKGEIKAQWVKDQIDNGQRLEIIRDAIAEICNGVKRLPKIKPPKTTRADLCNVYTMTDCHMGMLAWHKESGADWDLKIARQILGGAFRAMLDAAPAAKTGFLSQLGDWLHADSIVPLTPTAGHILDVDGRFSKVVAASVDLLTEFVEAMLQKHDKVVVLMAEGNHDISSSIWLRQLFKRLFAGNKRVEIIDSEIPYYAYQHGQTMLAFHHGHMKKNDALPLLFAAQFPKVWGATTKRYCHVGHRHHKDEKDHSGMRVTQHPTLAARDAYAARGGWISEREATAITYHSTHGQVGSTTVTPEMISADA